ncbi:MAG: Flp pilus assembly protein CpaB, partial [Planctomycetaceae bacterium]|nr:Flp pilus assembly protein CpaB [Planctomycetaceae bacterium]
IMGRTLQIAVEKGEVFMPELLYPEGMGPDIAERLSPGYRAVTVPIENIGAVHGFARPGSIVDILFRADAESERPEMTLTLLERIEVLAINTSLLPNAQIALDNDKGTVTLSVTPQQAKVLKVVEGRGELSLTLRNPDDTLELAPFELGEVDPNIGNVSFLNDARADNLADRNTADRRSTNDSADSNSNADTVDRVIGAAEQVTMDDLLGLPRKAPTKQMIVYKGGSREVVEFEAPADSRVEFMMKGGRIKTPIAHEIPPHRRSPLSTAGFDPRDLSPSAKAGDN